MSKRPPSPPAPQGAPSASVPLRSPSGHLIGYLDTARMVLAVKPRSGRPIEEIDLRPFFPKP